MKTLVFPSPSLQASFILRLRNFREKYLQDALLKTIKELNIPDLDRELSEYVSGDDLAKLAGQMTRGEMLFAVPLVLRRNPYLISYYRMLMGYSRKEFYGKGFGAGKFLGMEANGVITHYAEPEIPELCRAFCIAGSYLLKNIHHDVFPNSLLDDLTLLTAGAQFRGSTNNKIGADGITDVFEIIREIVSHSDCKIGDKSIEILNATGRIILIEFASDPDIVIREAMASGTYRNIVAIEIKAGKDVANIHNRLGEAEKSHQNAKSDGFTEFWTIVNVSVDQKKAKKESPTTTIFYNLNELGNIGCAQHSDFKARILSLTSIKEKRQ